MIQIKSRTTELEKMARLIHTGPTSEKKKDGVSGYDPVRQVEIYSKISSKLPTTSGLQFDFNLSFGKPASSMCNASTSSVLSKSCKVSFPTGGSWMVGISGAKGTVISLVSEDVVDVYVADSVSTILV